MGLFYLQNKEYERCVRPKGGSAAADNVLSVFDEKCTGKALKFILEPHKDEEVQYTIFPLPGDAKTWAILGKNRHFSKQADRGDFRQIKSRQKTGLQCIESKMQGSKVLAVAAKCRSKKDPQAQGFVYDRFTGGHLRDNKKRCLTRHGSTVAMEKCSNDEKQKWKYKCSAWVNGDAKEGRVLQLSGNKITAAQWTGKKPQLWDFKQVASHNKCGNKRFKIFDFDGSDRSGVRSRNFLGMPSTEVTVALWLKGTKGTVFSYASKMQTKSFVIHLTAFNKLVVYIRGQKFETDKKITAGKWTHIAVAWRNSGKLTVYKDGIKIFEKRDAARKERITAGGCLMLGQAQSTYCDKLDETKAFIGQVADLQVWRGRLNPFAVREIMYKPVPKKVLKGVGKLTAPEAGKRMRLGYISRQYGEQELKKKFPPVCDLDKYKLVKVTGPSGNMRYTGSGDVHYRNFAGCCYDDQSVGEWVVVKVDKENWAAAPLMIQYRTSPNKINGAWCTWCQKGAVSYIDGCAVKFYGDQASAGFGGYNIDPYPAYAALNGKKLSGNRWKRTKNMRVRAHNSGFEAVLNDGTQIRCARGGSIYVNMPKKYTGKIAGLAGTGKGGNSDWACGPNSAACAECKEGKLLRAMQGQCPHHYVYSKPNHPLNGNKLSKPLVRWFKSWQVDGKLIPSAFYYQGGRGAGSFNRITGEKIKPPSDTTKRPKGKRAAAALKCKDFRASKKAREKCIFDYMMFGDKSLKATKKDRMKQRQASIKAPTARSVRDISRYRNDGMWSSGITWGCVGPFLKMIAARKSKGIPSLPPPKPKPKPKVDHAERGAKCQQKMVSQLEVMRSLKAGQPIQSRVEQNCVQFDGKKLSLPSCNGAKNQKLIYNRLAGGVLTSKDGTQCLTRPKGKSTVSMDPCRKNEKTQLWKRQCGAWANGDKHEGRVLELHGTGVRAAPWTGAKKQLWHYKEVVKHSKCSNKRFKVLQFDGTKGSSIHLRNFIGMPNRKVTISMWMKGTKGTPFSYASKNNVNSIVLTNLDNMEFYIRGFKVVTGVKIPKEKWVHFAATWESKRGRLAIYINTKRVFKKDGFAKGERITGGGCLMLGQKQRLACGKTEDAFKGQLTDVQVWAEDLRSSDIRTIWKYPVAEEVVDKVGKLTSPEPSKKLRLAYLSRQYGEQELKKKFPPVCDLDKYKVKKVTGPSGNMRYTGSGDVHYRNFAGCCYDDQSVGEWVVVKVDKENWAAAPLMIQYRTSPNKINGAWCTWCQKGAVSYIDGCAVKFHDDQASAGFGGYNIDPYPAYAALNGKKLSGNQWKRTKKLSGNQWK